MRGEETGAPRPRGFWPALLVLVALLAAGTAGGQPTPGEAPPAPAVEDAVVSLADGVDVPELEGPPEAQTASIEGEVAAALEDKRTVSVIVRLREQVDLPSVAAEARSEGRARGPSARGTPGT